MKDFKTWCISFCVLLAVVTVMRFVIPECKLKSISDTFLSLIVIVAMFLPFTEKNANKASSFNFDTRDYSEKFDGAPQYEAAIEKYIEDALSSRGVEFKNVEVSAETDGEGYIVIDKINITAENPNEEEIKSIIRDECKLDEERVTFN